MGNSRVEQLFSKLNETTEEIQEVIAEPYLDALTTAMEMLFFHEVPEVVQKKLPASLRSKIKQVDITTYKTNELRNAIQLAILKGMKDSTQSQHMMTPEAVALLIGYLAEQLVGEKKNVRIFDPVSGTGNLLITVLDRLKEDVMAYASEVDPTLIRLSVVFANILEKQIEFFHQDSLGPLLMDPVDIVVADLPVGYYPDDVRASTFQLRAEEGLSYSHHLFIEQSLKYTKKAGYLLFIIPEFLFDSDQADTLRSFLYDHAHIVGIIRLPDSAFKSKQVKSILILQKKGEHTTNVKQPLLVQMPSFKNPNAMADILGQMNLWFKKYKDNL